MIMKLDHVAIYVKDLEATKEFFMSYFDGVSNEMYHNPRTGLSTYFLTFGDGSRLEIMNRQEVTTSEYEPFRGGLIHIAFSVGGKEAVDDLTARLKADGYEVLSGPRTTGDGYYESSVRGMENVIIEITE